MKIKTKNKVNKKKHTNNFQFSLVNKKNPVEKSRRQTLTIFLFCLLVLRRYEELNEKVIKTSSPSIFNDVALDLKCKAGTDVINYMRIFKSCQITYLIAK